MIAIDHTHLPVYRVIRRGWTDPLDSSFSRSQSDNRWNTADFPALYCCCSEPVARAVTLDIFRFAGIELTDLHPQARPQLAEIRWQGRVANMASPEGIQAAGFPANYPAEVSKRQTREYAAAWYQAEMEGVVCRSASLFRQGLRHWVEPHQRWSELAIFPQPSATLPSLIRRRDDLDWLIRSDVSYSPNAE